MIGGGVAGLTAAYVLQRATEVTLYEADDRLGGHADTHEVLGSDGVLRYVDTGFIVHNRRTYPTLTRLFGELGVATQESQMSMSISCSGCGLEYAGGRGLSGLLPSARVAARPRYLRLLAEVARFYRRAHELLASDEHEMTIREFLARHGFSRYFATHFLTPVIAAVWSTAPTRAGDYPARYLFTFLDNHGTLAVRGSPVWYTVVGGSARYVERVAKDLSAVRTSTPVRTVERTGGGVEVRDDADCLERYDGVVIAGHPHHALEMLVEPTMTEREVLGAIGYTANPALLHTDATLLPSTRRAQASWNYAMPACDALPSAVHVSYNLSRLQRLDTPEPYVLSLNSEDRVAPGSIIDRMDYEHPLYTNASVAARARLPELNDGVLAFAGAYHGWGFHEDGARSGVAAAASLGVPW